MQTNFYVQSAEYGKYYIGVDVNGYGTYNIWIGMIESDDSVGYPVDSTTTSNKSYAQKKYNKFLRIAEDDSYGWNSRIDNPTWKFDTNTSLNSIQEYILSNPKNIKASSYIRKGSNMKKYVKCNVSDAEIQNRIDSIATYDDFDEFESYLVSLNLDNDTEYKWYNKAFVKFFGREPFDERGNFIKSSKRLSSSRYINASNNISPVEQEILDIYNKHATLTDVGYSGFDFEDGTGTLFDVEVGYRFPDNRNEEDGVIKLGDVPFEYYFDDGDPVIDFQGNFSLLFDDEAEYYDISKKLIPNGKKYIPFKTVFYWGDIFEDILEAIQMSEDDYDDGEVDYSKYEKYYDEYADIFYGR